MKRMNRPSRLDVNTYSLLLIRSSCAAISPSTICDEEEDTGSPSTNGDEKEDKDDLAMEEQRLILPMVLSELSTST
jgi:hypothetical protein